jgi:hypothetical protein
MYVIPIDKGMELTHGSHGWCSRSFGRCVLNVKEANKLIGLVHGTKKKKKKKKS